MFITTNESSLPKIGKFKWLILVNYKNLAIIYKVVIKKLKILL